ncbi:MAG: Asp23/Gls24 family envelope stress response protein [Butyricicoccus pullicaecorum]|nr:Asp23/Gls24 family envelope stress response protein [Butyricicoccus pullicaecorum]
MADHKDYWTTAGDQGTIKISEDVVASIAALAASETEGVSGLYSSFTNDIASFLGKKNLAKGVRVVLGDDDTVEVEICYLAKYGFSICEVAKNVQEAVRTSVEAMTGLSTSAVNIYVGGVTFDASEESAVAAVPETQEKNN